MAKTVVGLFDDMTDAQNAVQELVNRGIPREEIGITTNNDRGDLGDAGGHGEHHAGSGAAAGAGIGAVLGGIGGILVGIGALTIPGIGPILAAGPIAAALAGAGIGAVAGGLIGALTGMGVPEEHAHQYAEGVRRGGTLVTVTASDAAAETAAEILNRYGAVDIDRRAAQWQERGWERHDTRAQPLSREDRLRERDLTRSGAQREVRVPVTEEQVQVGKQPVQTGGVRIYQRVEERPVQQDVQLREERVSVDRRPVDRPVDQVDDAAFQERTFEVRTTAEQPVVTKQARVAEEVVVRKDVDQRTETVNDTVRRTDVDVQPVPGTRRAGLATDEDVDDDRV